MTRLDRRALFASGAAAALLAASGLSADAAPKPGGTLRIALPREGDLLQRLAARATHETLTEIGPDGALRGELATGWNSDTDASIWDFTLRPQVRFHDGSEMTAADVLGALQHLPSLIAAEATDGNSIRLTLDHPQPDLPFLLASEPYLIGRDGAGGTGCYRTVRAADGRSFRAVRAQDHHRRGSAGWAEQIEMVVIPDPATRAEALRDGFVDIAVLPKAQDLRSRGDYRFHPDADHAEIVAARHVGMPRRVSRAAPLDDLRLAERWWLTHARA